MPQKDNPNMERLKAISMFDPNTDFNNDEAKDHLSVLFRELIMSSDPTAKEFFKRFLSSVDKIIKDMGIVTQTASDSSEDEVDMSPTPPEEKPEPTQDKQQPNPNAQQSKGLGAAAVPDDLLNAGYNPLIDRANSFLYI